MINDLFVRVGTEATHGTVATTFVSVPVEEFSTTLTEPVSFLEEARGNGEEAAIAQKGLLRQEHTLKGRIYHDTHEPFLRSVFGAPTIVANADGTRTLTFNAVADPASLSTQWFDAVQARQTLNSVVDEYGVEFGGEDALVWNAKLMAMPETDIATPTASFSSAVPFIHWQAAATIGGVAAGTILTYKLGYKRNIDPRYLGGIAGQRTPARWTYGKRGGSLELMLDFQSQAEYTQAKNLAQRPVVVTFTDTDTIIGSAARNPSISFNVPKAVWSTKEIDLGDKVPALKVVSEKILAGTNGSLVVTLVTV